MTTSSAVRHGITLTDWKTQVGSSHWSGRLTRPSVGRISPPSRASKVDFPLPDGPTSAISEPKGSSAERCRNNQGPLPKR